MVHEKTGDYVIGQDVDRERGLTDLRFTTKNGKLVCVFLTQWGAYAKGDAVFPIRIYGIKEAPHPVSYTHLTLPTKA